MIQRYTTLHYRTKHKKEGREKGTEKQKKGGKTEENNNNNKNPPLSRASFIEILERKLYIFSSIPN